MVAESLRGSKFEPNSVRARSPDKSASTLPLFFPKHMKDALCTNLASKFHKSINISKRVKASDTASTKFLVLCWVVSVDHYFYSFLFFCMRGMRNGKDETTMMAGWINLSHPRRRLNQLKLNSEPSRLPSSIRVYICRRQMWNRQQYGNEIIFEYIHRAVVTRTRIWFILYLLRHPQQQLTWVVIWKQGLAFDRTIANHVIVIGLFDFRAFPADKELVLVHLFKWIGATGALLHMERMVAQACPICHAIVLHDQRVHVSTTCVMLVIFDAKEDLNAGPDVFDKFCGGDLTKFLPFLYQLVICQFLDLYFFKLKKCVS